MKTPKDAVFVPTREQRNLVCLMTWANWTPAMMANDLGITQTLLKRHFRDELRNGKEQVRERALLGIAIEGFKNKSIPALKAVVALSVTRQDSDSPRSGKGKAAKQAPPMQQATMRMGKKVNEKLEAEAAAKGIFETPSVPRGSTKLQ